MWKELFALRAPNPSHTAKDWRDADKEGSDLKPNIYTATANYFLKKRFMPPPAFVHRGETKQHSRCSREMDCKPH